jgi:hypothetical protein
MKFAPLRTLPLAMFIALSLQSSQVSASPSLGEDRIFFNGFEGTDASAWWTTGTAGIDYGKGVAFAGENEGWIRATTGWNALNVSLGDPASTYANYSNQCLAMIWIRTSSTLTNGYFSVRDFSKGNAIVAQVGPFGNWPGSKDPRQLGYNYVPIFFTQPGNDQLFLDVGFWGNGRDAWIQIDDASVICGKGKFPSIVQGTDYSNGDVSWSDNSGCGYQVMYPQGNGVYNPYGCE